MLLAPDPQAGQSDILDIPVAESYAMHGPLGLMGKLVRLGPAIGTW